MGEQTIKYYYKTDGFPECKTKVKQIICCMKDEVYSKYSLFRIVRDVDWVDIEVLATLYNAFNNSMNGCFEAVCLLTEPYLEKHEDEVWRLRDEMLATYDEAKELYYKYQPQELPNRG